MTSDREINERLARVLDRHHYQRPDALDMDLLKCALRRPDASDPAILELLLDVASEATGAENRALLSTNEAEAAQHRAAAAACRRRAGIPRLGSL